MTCLSRHAFGEFLKWQKQSYNGTRLLRRRNQAAPYQTIKMLLHSAHMLSTWLGGVKMGMISKIGSELNKNFEEQIARSHGSPSSKGVNYTPRVEHGSEVPSKERTCVAPRRTLRWSSRRSFRLNKALG